VQRFACGKAKQSSRNFVAFNLQPLSDHEWRTRMRWSPNDVAEETAVAEHESLRVLLQTIEDELRGLSEATSSPDAIELVRSALQQGRQVLASVFCATAA
jgi:hypothetical protein